MQKQSLSDRRRGGFLTDPKVVPYVFVAPFVIYFLVVYLYPTIATILMSFQRIEGPTSVEWIGLKNYERLFSRNYIQALETTARYAFWDVVVLTSVPLLVAVILHSKFVKFASFFKSLFFIPALTSIIVAGIVFRLAFGTLPTAPVNRLVQMFPDSADAYAARAAFETEQKLYDIALYDWDEAIRRRPLNEGFVVSKADILITLNRMDEARRCLNAAIRRGIPRYALKEWLDKCK